MQKLAIVCFSDVGWTDFEAEKLRQALKSQRH